MFNRKISVFILTVLLLPGLNPVYAQSVKVDTIKATCPNGIHRQYIFPHIRIAGNNAVANAINHDLIKDMLDIDPQKVKKSIFENVWATKQQVTILDDISFEYRMHRNKIFSVSFTAEGCGAYCENFSKYYNYDLQTGKRIAFTELLTTAGRQYALDSLTRFKKHQLQNKIIEATNSLPGGDSVYYQDMINLYQQCAEDSDTIDPEYTDYIISDSAFIFITGRCSAHVNRNVDELDEFRISIRFTDRGLLSPYGMRLLRPAK